MELKPEMHLRQTQKLIMTPQLQQAIKLLQLSSLELSERIDQELVENPALEIEEREDDFGGEIDEETLSRELLEKKKDEVDESFNDGYLLEEQSFSQTDYRNRSGEDKKREFIEGTLFREETLEEYLIGQIRLLSISEEDFEIAEILISCIDTMGYLSVSLEDISKETGISLEKLQEILRTIQGLDPSGIGARDIKECLLIQLKNKGEYPLAEKIISEFLNEVKLRKFDEIAKKLKISTPKVEEAFSIISKLEPYPGRQFYSGAIRYVVPDVIIEEREEGFEVASNNYALPRLRVNNYFEKLLKAKDVDKRIKDFVLERIQRARTFIHSIDQRENTLMKVTRAILEEQIDFFQKGPKFLKPLTLKDISYKVGLHESTVSRITSSKYAQTPFGVFQLKYFFSNPIPTDGAKEYSSTSIREMIKDIVESESGKKHLSDQKIANMLEKKGIKIARRTVAKYRKMLNILPSNLRR